MSWGHVVAVVELARYSGEDRTKDVRASAIHASAKGFHRFGVFLSTLCFHALFGFPYCCLFDRRLRF